MDLYKKAAEVIKSAKYLIAFTGAGISVESGIPTFRGENGIWSKYDPKILDLDFFLKNPEVSWKYIKEIFYNYMEDVKPNKAHYFLAKLEKAGILKGIITQNIDNVHQNAGSKNVVEFHGSASRLECTKCKRVFSKDINSIYCPVCNGILKPDFIFFKEAIKEDVLKKLLRCVKKQMLF